MTKGMQTLHSPKTTMEYIKIPVENLLRQENTSTVYTSDAELRDGTGHLETTQIPESQAYMSTELIWENKTYVILVWANNLHERGIKLTV